MWMRFGISIKSVLSTCLNLEDYTVVRHEFQVAVYGSQTDVGEPFTYSFVQFIRSGMTGKSFKLFKYEFALF